MPHNTSTPPRLAVGVLLLSVLLGKGYGGSVDDGGRAVCVTMADFFCG